MSCSTTVEAGSVSGDTTWQLPYLSYRTVEGIENRGDFDPFSFAHVTDRLVPDTVQVTVRYSSMGTGILDGTFSFM